MTKSSRGRVSPALVISIIALVLAAGGTSFASAPVSFVAKTLGLNGVQIVRGPEIENPHESQSSQEVVCPAGMHAIGGGVEDSGGTEQSVNEMYITSSGAGNTDNAFK